jgi:isopentenyl-diphosphate delta-isomerase
MNANVEERVVLVDEFDREISTAEKVSAHRRPRLHRAVSVLVFNHNGDLLLQRRALSKYHSPGLWSNTCCTHPRPGERPLTAATRCLGEEMGIECPLDRIFTFTYYAEVGSGLVEYELDHVFIGFHDETPAPDPAEVSDWRWSSISELLVDVRIRPHLYTAWFPVLLRQLHRYWATRN